MNFSLDDRMSNRLGVDNRLCPPYKSISFWGTVALAIIVLAAAMKNVAYFFASGNGTLWVLFVILIVSAQIFYAVGRSRIADISARDIAGVKGQLRTVSYALTVLAGLVSVSVLFAVLLLK
jgi:hypothetical protein